MIVVIVLRNERLYPAFKKACYSCNVVSQVVTTRVARKNNLSVAGNILRQVNSKIGGDLYNLRFP